MNDVDPDLAEASGQNEERIVAGYREELVWRMAQTVPQDGRVEKLEGLFLSRASSPTGPFHGVSFPSFCVIAQGSKEVYLGETCYRYDPYHYLLSTAEMPVVIQQFEASPKRPHLSLRLNLAPSLVASVMLDAGIAPPRREARSGRTLEVSPLGADLMEATVRLVRLADAPPAEARVLLPLVKREIVFRLLAGQQSSHVRHLAVLGGHTARIARAIERLRNDFDKPLRIENLAKEMGMSPSGFHEHFKAVTAMSPLQFQKHLRLQEARRLMLGEDLDASGAAFRVGYEDTSQFSKEYKRQFGEPPMRDVERLRGTVRVGL